MKCKTCGKNSEGEYCFQHKPRKPLSSSGKGLSRISDKKAENVQNNKHSSEMKQFFMNYWRTHKPHVCENCNKHLGKEPLSYMFDHVLEKSKYPELAFEEENIMYLCLECHDKKTRGFYSDVIQERINYLKLKFNIL